ncbi:MAG: hypothetical protein QOG77_3658 [Solirubrobacteraceae bacterium]|nr:hypothetical protein [Solirubrobacteraceae bacterium]
MTVRARLLPLLAGGLLLLLPATSAAKGDDGDRVRTGGTCGGGASSELRLEADDGSIETRFEVRGARGAAAWRVVIVQERRVVWRGSVRPGGGRSFRVERDLTDLAGADTVSVRAFGPRGVTCRATGTLTGG